MSYDICLAYKLDVLQVLLALGASPDSMYLGNYKNNGKTGLHLAVEHRDLSLVTWLLKNKCDVNVPDRKAMETALMKACKLQNLELVKLLLKHKADVHARDQYENCALVHAITTSRPEDNLIQREIMKHFIKYKETGEYFGVTDAIYDDNLSRAMEAHYSQHTMVLPLRYKSADVFEDLLLEEAPRPDCDRTVIGAPALMAVALKIDGVGRALMPTNGGTSTKYKMIARLEEWGVDLNYTYPDGNNLLSASLHHYNADMFHFLRARGVHLQNSLAVKHCLSNVAQADVRVFNKFMEMLAMDSATHLPTEEGNRVPLALSTFPVY